MRKAHVTDVDCDEAEIDDGFFEFQEAEAWEAAWQEASDEIARCNPPSPFAKPPAEEFYDESDSEDDEEADESPAGVASDQYGTANGNAEAAMDVDESSAIYSRRQAETTLAQRHAATINSVSWWVFEHRRCLHEITGQIRESQSAPAADCLSAKQLQMVASQRHSATLAAV